jgi:catechol 2,3-dioxygenase-like lactoylglutathione lyase family enzyme
VIKRIHHTGISVRDRQLMLCFYRDLLGFEVVHELEWQDDSVTDRVIGVPGSAAWKATLKAGDSFLEIFSFSTPAATNSGPLRASDKGYTHLALLVTDIEGEYQRLRDAGIHFNSPVQTFGPVKSVYGLAPEGNIFEMLEVSEPNHPYLVQQETFR